MIATAAQVTSGCIAGSEITRPFFQSNSNPLVSIFGLPPAETAQLLPSGGQLFSLVLEVANSFSTHTKGYFQSSSAITWRVGRIQISQGGIGFIEWNNQGLITFSTSQFVKITGRIPGKPAFILVCRAYFTDNELEHGFRLPK